MNGTVDERPGPAAAVQLAVSLRPVVGSQDVGRTDGEGRDGHEPLNGSFHKCSSASPGRCCDREALLGRMQPDQVQGTV